MMDPTELTKESTTENANGGMQLFEKLHEGNVTVDVSGEYILPDYMPPVEKLLRVEAQPVIDEKYCSGEKITLGGHICWKVLYLSGDGEIKSFETEERFTESCTIHRLDDNCIVWVQCAAENPVCRLSSPQKMSLRCQCELTLTPVTPRDVTPRVATENESDASSEQIESVQMETGLSESCVFLTAQDRGVRCSEDIETTDGEIDRIISEQHMAILTDAKTMGEKLEYRCDVSFSILYHTVTPDGTGTYGSVQAHFPITRTVEVPQWTDNIACFGECEVKELGIQIGTDRSGQRRLIELDYVVDTDFTAYENKKTPVVRDAFSVEYPTRLQTQSCRTMKHRKTDRVNFTVSGMLPVTQDSPGQVIDLRGEIHQVEVRGDKNKFVISGNVDLSAILRDADGDRIFAQTGEIPFQYEGVSDGFMGDIDKRICCAVTDLRGRVEGGQIRCDMEIHLCFNVLEKVNQPLITAIVLDTEQPLERQEEDGMVLYYPRAGESVWDIAKKYRVSPDAIRQSNGMDPACIQVPPGEKVLSITFE